VDYLDICGVSLDDLRSFDRFNVSLYKLRDCYRSKGLNIIPFDVQISPLSLGDSHEDIDTLYIAFSGRDVIEGGRITINATQENYEAFQRVLLTLKKWYEDGILPKGALTELDLTNNVNFINGLTAMTWNNVGTMIGAAKRQHPDWKFAVVPLPTTEKHPQPFGILMPRTLFIPSDRPPEYKEAAKLFIKFILNKTNYEKWYGDQGGFEYADVPIYRSLLNRGAYLTDPVWKGVAEVFKGGGRIYMWSRFASMTFGESYNRALAQIYAQNVVIGAMSAKEATDAFLRDLFNIYRKWGW
jgi:ABC-type glycerol-3-phosphate transport system substrate-binding protein